MIVTDHAAMTVALLGISMPDFFLGILLFLLFSLTLEWLPVQGYVPLTTSVVDNLRHGPAAHRDHRRPGGHRLDHRDPKRLGPVDREEVRVGVAQELVLLRVIDLPEELDEGCEG